MQGLVDEAKGDDSTCFVFKRTRGRNPLRLARYIINRTAYPWMVRKAAKAEGEVVIFHPQTIGLSLMREIIDARPLTWMYVLDSSTFCVRSYNCLPAESAPCLRCVGNDRSASKLNGCSDWFHSGLIQDYLPGWVRSGRLKLIAQCESHAKVLKSHFGEETPVVIVPLSVPDINPPKMDVVRPQRKRPLAVYHGASIHAKGIMHVISLAILMPDWDFLVPASTREMKYHLGKMGALPPNLTLRQMNWPSGLFEQVQMADIVLCPSSWSAPVEGAVLKSLAHNGLVGLYVHETAFAAELPADARVAIDPLDLEGTAAHLRRLISNPEEAKAIRVAARRFISHYSAQSQLMLKSIRSICGLT